MRSLMIRGFPRSMTSLTYNVLYKALGHQFQELNPATRRSLVPMNGELLARSTDVPRIENTSLSPETFKLARPALRAHEKGYLIKDVLQPWIVNRYLGERPGSYVTLFIRRNLADILFRMKMHGWVSSKRVACPVQEQGGCKLACSGCSFWDIPPDEALARGILACDRELFQPLDRHDGVLDWEKLIQEQNPDYLFDVVEELGYTPRRSDWMSKEAFKNKRKVVLAYRLDPVWKQGRELLDSLGEKG